MAAAFLVAKTSAAPSDNLLDYLVRSPWSIVRKIFVPPCPPAAAPAAPAPAPAAALAYDEDAVAAFGFDDEETPASSTVAASNVTLGDSPSSVASSVPALDVTSETAISEGDPSDPPATDVPEEDKFSTRKG